MNILWNQWVAKLISKQSFRNLPFAASIGAPHLLEYNSGQIHQLQIIIIAIFPSGFLFYSLFLFFIFFFFCILSLFCSFLFFPWSFLLCSFRFGFLFSFTFRMKFWFDCVSLISFSSYSTVYAVKQSRVEYVYRSI